MCPVASFTILLIPLIDKKRIEDLNEKICKLGEVKVQHMMEGKEFKKLFVHLEWELRRMLMEYNELQIRLKDIQRFRITREVQRYLDAENYEALIATELQKLDKAIEMLKSHHEKSMNEKRGRLKQITSVKTKKIDDKNSALLDDLKEMNVTLNERLQVYETVDQNETTEGTRAKRYQEILQRQKLVDIAKSQAKEVAVLRAEVERLRMRTFPALVQNK
jgi:cilia- and flagella-associated protein 43